MTAIGSITGIPVEELTPAVAAELARLGDENALLRAAAADLRARLEALETTSERDPLTGLPNRAAFMRSLDRAVSQANRYGTPAALLYLDIDGLDALNARHGEVAGDAALIHVARQLDQLVRTSDFAARVGDDEFGMLLDHLDGESAIETAERIGRCIGDAPLDLGAAQVKVAVTVGVATILRGDSVEDVNRRGELTMRKAKLAA